MGTFVPLRKLTETLDSGLLNSGLPFADVVRPPHEMLASGGDGRLSLNQQDNRNAYGCTPFPRRTLLDFGSSTASTISERAFARVQRAQSQIWLDAKLEGKKDVFDDRVEAARSELLRHLDVSDAEIVFSPSGTDAQLHALFLAKALLGGPLTTIVVGVDQTGSGTLHTARGCHFSERTSQGRSVELGTPLLGLGDQVVTIGVPFCDSAGHLRTEQEMDATVYAAVQTAVGQGQKVLLQTMDSSKLGWHSPSLSCIDTLTAIWPNEVCVVVDACQMRCGLPQLQDYLRRGHFVLITGSKFFTGPAFSGALLVPGSRAVAIDGLNAIPQGLSNYTTRYDWPRRWPQLRKALSIKPNYGQWLRWEATLEEMDAYFLVPQAFRSRFLKAFAEQAPRLIGTSEKLQLLEEHRGTGNLERNLELSHRTIFPFVPHRNGQPIPLSQCIDLYRAMGRNLSFLLPQGAPAMKRQIAERICQIGQPVALRHRPGAALRICSSARLVTSCWARSATLQEALQSALTDVSALIEKLDLLIAHPHLYQSSTT